MKISTRVWAIIFLMLPIWVGILGSIVGVIYLITQFGAGVELTNALSAIVQNPDAVWFSRASIIVLALLGASIIGLILVIKAIGYSQTAPESSIRRGWSLMKKSFWRWVLILTLGVAIIFLFTLFYDLYFGGPNPLVSPQNPRFLVGNVGGMLIQIVLSALFSIIILGFAIDIVQGVVLSRGYGKLFKRSGLVINWIIAQIVYNLVVGFGFLLLIVPGIYWAVRFAFWKMFVVDKGYGPIQALKASWTITKGHRWEVALFKIYESLINIPGLLLLGLGLYATIPTGLLAYTDYYNKLGVESGKFGFTASSESMSSSESISGQTTADVKPSNDSDDVGGEVPFSDSWEDDGEQSSRSTSQQ